MTSDTKSILIAIGASKNDLASYKNDNGEVSYRRFWNLFRSDLQRLPPDKLTDYLKDQQGRIQGMGGLGKNLDDKFFMGKSLEDQRRYRDALIHACMEIDAASKLARSSHKDKRILYKKLGFKEELFKELVMTA
jgi:hypothetical protein